MALIPYPGFNLEKWFEEDWPDIWDWPKKILPKASNLLGVKAPKVDIYETDKNLVAEIEMPGVDPKNINVEVNKDMIVVEAKSEEKKEEKKKGYYRQELSKGYLKRVIPLPLEVKENKAEAVYDKGMLKISVPKVETDKKKEKSVKVKVKEKNGKTTKNN